jgi:hypothetical protein
MFHDHHPLVFLDRPLTPPSPSPWSCCVLEGLNDAALHGKIPTDVVSLKTAHSIGSLPIVGDLMMGFMVV